MGIIDGFVYLGTFCMTRVYKMTLPEEQLTPDGNLIGPATDPDNWISWPAAMVPMALIGFLLALRVWNAKPKGKTKEEDKPTQVEAKAVAA